MGLSCQSSLVQLLLLVAYIGELSSVVPGLDVHVSADAARASQGDAHDAPCADAVVDAVDAPVAGADDNRPFHPHQSPLLKYRRNLASTIHYLLQISPLLIANEDSHHSD